MKARVRMDNTAFEPKKLSKSIRKKKSLRRRIFDSRYLYLLALPAILYILVIKILPIWGLSIAFVEYNPFIGLKSIIQGPFIGFSVFKEVFGDKMFPKMVINTLAINSLGLVFLFPIPIILSIMLNEVRSNKFKRVTQTLVYFPHFVSWVVVVSLTMFLFSADIGLINKLRVSLGMDPVMIMSTPKYFWGMVVGQQVWRETGWGTIIILAAITGIDQQLYEAARIDGANRLQQIWSITLPSIASTIIILLIMRIGKMADVSLEQLLLMQNPLVYNVSEVFDTFAYNMGITQGFVSVGVAVGLFKSVINMFFVVGANIIVRRAGHEGIY